MGPSKPPAPSKSLSNAEPAAPLRSLVADDSILRQFLPQFVGQLPPLVAAMAARLDRQDLAELSGYVHQLKGAGAFYGFPQITEAAEEAERRVKRSDSLEAVRQGVEDLVRLVRSVEGYDRRLEK